MGFTVRAIGSAVPDQSVTLEEAVSLAAEVVPASEHRKVVTIYRGSGVEKRHSVLLRERDDPAEAPAWNLYPTTSDARDLGPRTSERMRAYEDHAGSLAAEAITKSLAASGFAPSDVSHLILVTCSGFVSPGIDIELIGSIGLRRTLERVQIGFMGCHGALNGLRVAEGLVAARPGAVVVLCSIELCSLHYQYTWDLPTTVANALFADGSAALVGTDAGDGWKLKAAGTVVVPDTEHLMSWRIGDHGFVMGLSSAVPRMIEASLRPWLDDWLTDQGYAFSDIGSWAIHPGGPSIIKNVQRALDLDDDALATSLSVLQELGNMSSSTILFIIERLIANDAPLPCVAMAFGPGLTVEAVLFDR